MQGILKICTLFLNDDFSSYRGAGLKYCFQFYKKTFYQMICQIHLRKGISFSLNEKYFFYLRAPWFEQQLKSESFSSRR